MVNFTEVVKDYQDGVGGLIGAIRDTWLDEQNPTFNNGANNKLWIGYGYSGFARKDQRAVIEIQMPNPEDIDGFDELVKVELWLKIVDKDATKWMHIAIVELDDIWDEGNKIEAAGWANWNEAQPSVPWVNGTGAIKSRVGSLDDTDIVIDSYRNTLVAGSYGALFTDPYWGKWDLTTKLAMSDKKSFVVFDLDREDATNNVITFGSNDSTPALGWLPILKITYRDYKPDAFGDKDSALTIEPNEDNREQPILKWGGNSDSDFVNFKLYRETSPITSVIALTPIATITSPTDQEYIDVGALVDGTKYYYMVIAEDNNNTGDNSTFSANVSYTKPSITTRAIVPTGAGGVGTSKRVAVTSPINIKKLYVDFKDGIQSWYEYELPGISKFVDHIYTIPLTTFNPDVRIEDELGFWSSLLPTTTSASIIDGFPTAKLLVNIKRDHVGVEITLNAALCQPAGADVTITKYRFKRDASDSWQDNGTDPIFTFDSGTYPGTIGVKTASVELTVSSGVTPLQIGTVDYELESGDPVELIFTRNTRIHEIQHELGFDKDIREPLEGEGVDFQFKTARRAERITIHGTTHTPDMETDMTIIRDLWIDDTYIRLRVKNEIEGKDVLYDGKIESDVSIGHSYPNLQTWSFNMVIFNRTEV